MPTKAAYEGFLGRFGLSERDVPGIVPELLVDEAKAIWGRAWSDAETKEQMLKGLESNTNVLIERMAGSLEARLESLGAPPTPDPYYAGVFPTRSFNAQAVRVDGGALLLIDTGCFALLEALIMLWGCLDDVQDSVRRGAKIVCDYVERYVIPDPRDYDLPEMHRDGYRLLAYTHVLTKAEEFVLGHELGHLRFGHLHGQRAPGSGGIYPQNRNWDDELAADVFGLDLLTHRRDGLELRTGCAGPLVFFAAAGLIERALARGRSSWISWTDSHPPSIARAAVLERILDQRGLLDTADLGHRFNWWANECAALIEKG